MTDIFFSYSREDRDRVAFIAAALEAEGYDLWWDQDIPPGETYRNYTSKKLREAKCVLVVWSETSVRSRWVIGEAEEGLERETLVPVLIDDVVREVPIDFRSVQAANLIKWRGDRNDPEWKRVVARVKHHVTQPAKGPQRYKKPKRSGGGRATAAIAIFFAIVAAGVGLLYWTAMNPPELERALSGPIREKETTDGFTVAHEQRTKYVRVRRVAVYKQPDTDADVIGGFEPNEAVAVTGRVDKGLDGQSWYQVVAPDGSIGYVLVTTLTDEAPQAEEPEEPRIEEPAQSGPQVGERFRDCSDCPEMVVVPAGSFRMGDLDGSVYADEKPAHTVTFPKPFAVGVYEVTFGEWDACIADGACGGYRPSDEGWGRERQPAINVSWEDAQGYVAWLSRKTGKTYRLLSEAEWEYAARAGSTTKYHFGDSESSLCRFANGADLTAKRSNPGWTVSRCDDGYLYTASAGSFQPNAFGLYDVHGNVWEWVQDCWNESYSGAPSTGRAWEAGDCSSRVLRGGSWFSKPGLMRSAYRSRDTSTDRLADYGFRLSRTID